MRRLSGRDVFIAGVCEAARTRMAPTARRIAGMASFRASSSLPPGLIVQDILCNPGRTGIAVRREGPCSNRRSCRTREAFTADAEACETPHARPRKGRSSTEETDRRKLKRSSSELRQNLNRKPKPNPCEKFGRSFDFRSFGIAFRTSCGTELAFVKTLRERSGSQRPDADGATAPETLRHQDRCVRTIWREAPSWRPPKGKFAARANETLRHRDRWGA